MEQYFRVYSKLYYHTKFYNLWALLQMNKPYHALIIFLKLVKNNNRHSHQFHKKLFLKALEYYMFQNNFLYDLRTKGTRYGILKKKIQNPHKGHNFLNFQLAQH